MDDRGAAAQAIQDAGVVGGFEGIAREGEAEASLGELVDLDPVEQDRRYRRARLVVTTAIGEPRFEARGPGVQGQCQRSRHAYVVAVPSDVFKHMGLSGAHKRARSRRSASPSRIRRWPRSMYRAHRRIRLYAAYTADEVAISARRISSW